MVQGFAPFGVFVQLNDRIKGLVHKSNVKVQHSERDPIIVRVIQIRSNGNIDLEESRDRLPDPERDQEDDECASL